MLSKYVELQIRKLVYVSYKTIGKMPLFRYTMYNVYTISIWPRPRF